MKTLVYVRHSIKGSRENSEFIMEEGLDIAQDEAAYLPFHTSQFRHFFYGPMYRTLQTLLAMVTAFGMHGRVHEKIDLIGNNAMFDSWREAGVKFGGKPNIEAMREGLTPEHFETACANVLNGVLQMFELMGDGGVGLAIGHSPAIELAAEAAGLSMKGIQLKENQAVVFTQEDNAMVTVTLP